MSEWSPERSAELYQVDAWSASFFSVSANGTLQVHPRRNGDEKIDVPQLVEELKKLGREDIMIVCGGVIPAQDYDYLYKNGASAIFGPGTVIPDSARKVLQMLLEQVEE